MANGDTVRILAVDDSEPWRRVCSVLQTRPRRMALMNNLHQGLVRYLFLAVVLAVRVSSQTVSANLEAGSEACSMTSTNTAMTTMVVHL